MAEVTRHKCDQCGREVVDRYLHPGWIQISALGTANHATISVSIDRENGDSGNARSGYHSIHSQLDLCCLECLNDFITGLVQKRMELM